MMEVIITSSVLILLVIGLRFLLRGRISLRLQYALWGLVALRLLLPFSLTDSPVSVMNLFSGIGGAADRSVYVVPLGRSPLEESGVVVMENRIVADANSFGYPVLSEDGKTVTRYAERVTVHELLLFIWLMGTAAAAAALLLSNLRFAKGLKKRSVPGPGLACPLPVRVAEGLPSPCLYGALRPVIYLTPQSLEDEARLRHILAHELTHFRHGDHIWSLLRGICIAVHWFNPLVWIAASLSRRDCELACDEGALLVLGEENRAEYGRTLIGMMTPRATPADLLCAATTMTCGKGGIRERIVMIARKPRMLAVTLAAVLLAALAAAGCTFTGAGAAKVLTAQEALDRLEASITYQNGELSFTLPDGYPDASNWNILISGRQEFEDGFSRSVHYLTEENEARNWKAGERYVILSGDVSSFTDLSLDAYLPGEDGQTLERSVDLLPLLTREAQAEDVSAYTLTKLANGEVLASRALTGEEEERLAQDIIMDFMLKSAAWEGTDPDTLGECWLLRAESSSGEVSDYYAYTVDGRGVLQDGRDGRYSILNPDLYASLTALLSDRSRDLDASVSDAILNFNAGHYSGGEFKTESHVTLKTVENGNTVTVYLMAYYVEYDFPNGILTQAGGSHVPSALTFTRDESGVYTLTEYWEASDGIYYAQSIRNKFPADILPAVDTQLYVKQQSEACRKAAQGYLLTRSSEEELLAVIVSGPQEASNVYAYIKSHQSEYDTLLSRGDTTLLFIYSECLKGGQTDLRGAVLMTLLPTLMGEAYDPGDADTLQGWFDGFLAQSVSDREKNSDEYMMKYRPKAWLLLELLDERG